MSQQKSESNKPCAGSLLTVESSGENTGVPEYRLKTKNVSPFCDDCRPGDLANLGIRDFTDNEGKTWHCFKAFSCDHAVLSIGKIVSCRVRTAQIRGEARTS